MKPTIGPVCVKLIDAQTYTVTTNVDVTNAFKKGQWVTPPVIFMNAVTNSGTLNLDVDF